VQNKQTLTWNHIQYIVKFYHKYNAGLDFYDTISSKQNQWRVVGHIENGINFQPQKTCRRFNHWLLLCSFGHCLKKKLLQLIIYIVSFNYWWQNTGNLGFIPLKDYVMDIMNTWSKLVCTVYLLEYIYIIVA